MIFILTSFREFSKMSARASLQILENCNYAVELGLKLNFVLVGIQGDDIRSGNKMLTLALVWQLMEKYTLSLLAKLSPDGSPIGESEIIDWANQKLQDKGISISNFRVWTFIFLSNWLQRSNYSNFYIGKYHPTNAINLVLFFLQDPALKSSLPVIELIDAMRSGVIKSEFVIKSSGELGEEVSSHFHYWSINSQLVNILYAWGFLAHFHP